MFRLSTLREPLLEHYKSHPEAIFPAQHHADIVAALSEPLEDLSVSRPSSRLTWGVPVPGDPEHTIYVWIDALTVYLSAVGYPWDVPAESVRNAWPPNVQIIGKDILRYAIARRWVSPVATDQSEQLPRNLPSGHVVCRRSSFDQNSVDPRTLDCRRPKNVEVGGKCR